jgi:hypothetical protein
VGAVLTISWCLGLQTAWLAAHLNISTGRAFLVALWTALKAIVMICAIGAILLL